MPGDGITDVAPLTQQQWNGQYSTRSAKRPYGSQTTEGWIELVRSWEPVIVAQAQQQYLQPKPRQLNVRMMGQNAQEGWLLAPTGADVQAAVGAIQAHLGFPTRKQQTLPRQYLAQDIAVDVTTDPAFVSNFDMQILAASSHGANETRRCSQQSWYQVSRGQIESSYFEVTTNALGNSQWTGGGIVLP